MGTAKQGTICRAHAATSTLQPIYIVGVKRELYEWGVMAYVYSMMVICKAWRKVCLNQANYIVISWLMHTVYDLRLLNV